MREDLFKYIEEIKSATKEGKIPWEKGSNNSFIWKARNSKQQRINVVLQSLNNEIMFRLYDVGHARVLLEIMSSTANAETSKRITDLYDFVKANYYGSGDISILSDLLKNL